jgi:hypothetical protein
MAKIDQPLERKLARAPQAEARLIVRIHGDVDFCAERAASRGLQVTRKLKLLPALAIRGPAQICLSLLGEPWVVRIEEDRPVKAMG